MLCEKALDILSNSIYDGCKQGPDSKVYKLFDKISQGGEIKSKGIPNQQLIDEFDEPIIRKFRKCKLISPFMVNLGDVYLANMQ